MAEENEPAKLLLPYLQRADELQKHDPLVSYYCRLYAMERGMKIPQIHRTKTTNSLLISLINQLEKDKKSLKLGPDDHLHLEGFALNVFTKADKQDRAGRADLNTAKTFYAASIFFEIVNQIGELQPDLEQKQKYAAWKAADIRKAMKEGRKPVPGPPGGDENLSISSSTASGEYDLEPSRTDPAVKPAPDSDPSPELYDKVNNPQHSTKISPSSSNIPQSPHSNIPPPPSYPTDDYPSHNFHQPPPTNRSEDSMYSQPYHHQQHYTQEPEKHHNHYSQEPEHHHQNYPQEPVQHLPHNYSSHDIPSYSNPNFPSYPSFTESSLPAAPSHYPSYYQVSDASHSTPAASNVTNYPSSSQYNASVGNGIVPEAVAPTASQSYQYDNNYQPPPEKIAEAHKAARFAVGALAFDDVSTAVDYLKKSLELLTNPSSGQ